MAEETKNLIKLTPSEMNSALAKRSLIDEYNKRLQQLRTKQLYDSIKDGTKLRSDLTKKLLSWLGILETRIFDPQTIQGLDIQKVISLFEHVTAFSLSMQKQNIDMEQILKSYTDTQIERESGVKPSTPQTQQTKDHEDLRKILSQSLLQSLMKKDQVDNVVPIPVSKEKPVENFADSVPGSLEEKKPPEESDGLEDLPSLEGEEDNHNTGISNDEIRGKTQNDGDKDKIDIDLD